MPEEGAGRRCADCDRVVLDLRAVTRRELDAIGERARRTGEVVCAIVRHTSDGRVIVREPPLVPLRRAARGLAIALTLAGCEPEAPGPASAEVPRAPTSEPVDLGPPMLPVEQMPDAGAPDAAATPCEAPPEEVAVAPTAEQRALTRRKRRGHGVAIRPAIAMDPGFLMFHY